MPWLVEFSVSCGASGYCGTRRPRGDGERHDGYLSSPHPGPSYLLNCFVFVYSYSHATLLDHGGVLVNHFPVCRPLAGSVAAPSPLRLSTRPFPASTGD